MIKAVLLFGIWPVVGIALVLGFHVREPVAMWLYPLIWFFDSTVTAVSKFANGAVKQAVVRRAQIARAKVEVQKREEELCAQLAEIRRHNVERGPHR